MTEFKPHDYFEADDQGYISRKVFIEHVRNTYDHMRELATLIKGYDETIDAYLERWDQNLESLDDSIIGLLKEWIDDSTFATIINEEIFKTKADQVDLENVTAQLQQTALELKLRSRPRYGYIPLPSYFYPINFTLFRDKYGIVQHDIDLGKYKKAETIIYVSDAGSNSTGDGSITNPFRTVYKALRDVVVPGSSGSYLINADNRNITRGEFAYEGATEFVELENKKVAIVNTSSEKYIPIFQGVNSERYAKNWTGNDSGGLLTWELSSGNVYKATRSGASYVLDESHKKPNIETYEKMQRVTSVVECNSNPHSYYIDGSDIYVHTFDGRKPDKNIHAILDAQGAQFRLNNSTLYLEGFYVNTNNGLRVEGDIDSTYIEKDIIIGRTTRNTSNSLSLRDVGTTMSFNCIVHDSYKDGFNYHYNNIPSERVRDVFVFEYYCEGFDIGLDDTVETNNATTAHEGINILRVGSKGNHTKGMPCADINGCYSILIDCDMGGSIAEHPSYGYAYCFHTDINTSGKGAKVYMINSGGRGKITGANVLTDNGTELYIESYYDGLEGIKGSGTVNIIA